MVQALREDGVTQITQPDSSPSLLPSEEMNCILEEEKEGEEYMVFNSGL